MLKRNRVVGFLDVCEYDVLDVGRFCRTWGRWGCGLIFGEGCEVVSERV